MIKIVYIFFLFHKVLTTNDFQLHQMNLTKPWKPHSFNFPRKLVKLIKLMLFPGLPVVGALFIVFYFSIGLYMYYNPNIENATICG